MSISKNKSLVFIIVILLLTNIAVLVYFLRANKDERHVQGKNGLSTALQKEVGFNDDQIAKYREMKEEQFNLMRPMMDDMRRSKDSMFRLLGNEAVNDSVINSFANHIAEKQQQIDVSAFKHFKRIRGLCTPDQLPKYDSLVLKMIRKMGKPGKPEKAKPKDN